MPPGPLPKPDARRRNAPTIPTTELPAGGRTGRIPVIPKHLRLGKAGKAWWSWAWRTPQAAAWEGGGFEGALGLRAQLEDDLEALERPERPDIDELLTAATADTRKELAELIRRLAALATGRLGILREMHSLDTDLGLNPKGMAQLRWKVVEGKLAEVVTATEVDKRRRERVARAAAADPAQPARKPAARR